MKYLSVFLCTSCLIHAFQDDDHKDISWNIFCRHVVKRICFRRIVLYSANGAASFNLFSLQIILGDDIRSKLGLKTKVRRKSTTKMDARNQRSETISSEYANSSIQIAQAKLWVTSARILKDSSPITAPVIIFSAQDIFDCLSVYWHKLIVFNYNFQSFYSFSSNLVSRPDWFGF